MKRAKDVIISQILDVCMGGASKTRIVHRANLNFKTASPYIDLLTRNGLLDVKPGENTIYMTTEKGAGLRDSYKQIQRELSGWGQSRRNS
jgi:predicted transcriptional regulator